VLDRIIAPLVVSEPMLDDVAIAGRAFDRVNGTGQDFMWQGRPTEKGDNSLAEVAHAVREFRDQRLPRWRALKVID
jgi:hypothetical protein